MAVRLPRQADANDAVVCLTPMKRRHLRQVLRIEGQVYPRPWSLSLFLSEIGTRDGRYYIVAKVGSTVVGYAGLWLSVDEAHVTNLAVDPAWQRLKIGTRLLLDLTHAARSLGYNAMTLEVRVSNTRAQEMYRKFGYAPAGVRRNYYTDTNEDAIVMWAHDLGSNEMTLRLRAIEAGVPGQTVREGF